MGTIHLIERSLRNIWHVRRLAQIAGGLLAPPPTEIAGVRPWCRGVFRVCILQKEQEMWVKW